MLKGTTVLIYKQNYIRSFQILRALIHNEIKLIDPELKDRDPIEFRQ